jgi:hypothetical protein
MILLNTHPDYIHFGGHERGSEGYLVARHESLLQYIRNEYRDRCWHILPLDMGRFWTNRLPLGDGMKTGRSKSRAEVMH